MHLHCSRHVLSICFAEIFLPSVDSVWLLAGTHWSTMSLVCLKHFYELLSVFCMTLLETMIVCDLHRSFTAQQIYFLIMTVM